jgi:hypothetical protein
MIQIGTYPTRSAAELAQTALEATGIRSLIESDDAGGAYPFSFAGGVRLLVEEGDAEAAAAVLEGPADTDDAPPD